jgi:hypothetical protein
MGEPLTTKFTSAVALSSRASFASQLPILVAIVCEKGHSFWLTRNFADS